MLIGVSVSKNKIQWWFFISLFTLYLLCCFPLSPLSLFFSIYISAWWECLVRTFTLLYLPPPFLRISHPSFLSLMENNPPLLHSFNLFSRLHECILHSVRFRWSPKLSNAARSIICVELKCVCVCVQICSHAHVYA